MNYIANYHTHCYLCKHAKGSVEDYIKKAIQVGLKHIGMSDHAPFAFLSDRSDRMNVSDYPTYMNDLNQAIKKYSNQIHIYKGVEIEYFDGYNDHYERLLSQLDYMILGQHYIEINDQLKSVYHLNNLDDFRIYKTSVIKAMSTGYFKILAHPDIFLFNHGQLDNDTIQICKEIIEAAKKYNVLLEVNTNGLRRDQHEVDGQSFNRYTRYDFFKLVSDMNAKTIIGADAHKPSQLMDHGTDEALKFSKDLSLVVEEELVF